MEIAKDLQNWEHEHMTALRNAIAATDETLTSDKQLLEQPGRLAAEVKQLRERVQQLDAELDKGDSWAWIRDKFEKCRTQFKWHKPRNDSLTGTRYEVMGWLHVLFAHADPQVYIDITMEHQKRTDEAEAELAQLRTQLADPAIVHTNILRGTIALTKGQAIHIAGLPADIEKQLATATAELTRLREENGRLRAPVSDEEWGVIYDKCPSWVSGYSYLRAKITALIAARLAAPAAGQEPKP